MGYTSKDILNDIHKADPLPSKGKIDKKTKIENANKALDAVLTEDQYNAALFIYKIIRMAYQVDTSQELYNPRLEATNSNALEALTEAVDKTQPPTPLDNLYKKTCEQFIRDNKNFEYMYANRVLQFYGYNIQNLFKQANVEPPLSLFDGGKLSQLYLKDTIGQTKFIRSANHLFLSKYKRLEYQANGLVDNAVFKDTYQSFKKIFPEVIENFEKNTLNEDVTLGVDIYIVNAFIKLINSVIKVNEKNLAVKEISIPKDKVAPEKEKAIQAGNVALEKFKKSTIGNFLGNVLNKATQKAMNSMGIADVAKKLTESQEIKDDVIQAISEQHPELKGKTFKDLEQEWKTDHCKQLDQRDANFINTVISKFQSGKDLKKYWDDTENLDDFFDVVSRQLYYATEGKQYLYTWDKKQNYLCLKGDDKYSDYASNRELANREQDNTDIEQYNQKRAESGIDNLVSEYQSGQENMTLSEKFEAQFPSIKDYKELSRIVDIIANAEPLKKVELNAELGSCCPNQEDIETFKQYQSVLTEDQEVQDEYRWQIYNDLNDIIASALSIRETAIQIERYLNKIR